MSQSNRGPRRGADRLALISMPFVGEKRQRTHKNAVDGAKTAGVKQIVYTSLVNADDPMNPSVEKKDHIYTEEYHEVARHQRTRVHDDQ